MISAVWHLSDRSSNGKTGPIPVSTSGRGTCPEACPLKWFVDKAGERKKGPCYANGFRLGLHWDRVSSGERGDSWAGFLGRVSGIGSGNLWRHNQAGDLPGAGDVIDAGMLEELVRANGESRGFTYTHKPVLEDQVKPGMEAEAAHELLDGNRESIRAANEAGFAINLSASTYRESDALADLAIGPVVVLMGKDTGKVDRTPAGRKVVKCPAQYREDVTCKSCGLCSVRSGNRAVVGFEVHGSSAKRAELIANG